MNDLHLNLKKSFLERKLGRKGDRFTKQQEKTNTERATIFVAEIVGGLRDASVVFGLINELIINEESKFTEGNIWEFILEEEKDLLIEKLKRLKSFLEKIEKKAKH